MTGCLCREPEPGAIVVGITGTSGSGKTTVAAGIVRRLTAAGVRVAVVKHAAHGFTVDRAGSDSARFADAGAHLIVLAGPDGTALRMATAVEDGEQAARLADDAARAALGASANVLLIEGFQHPGRPVIEVGDQKPGIAGSVLATIPAVNGLTPEALEREIDRAADCVRALLAPP